MSMIVYRPGMTAADIRRLVDASKEPALQAFERNWGTRDVRKVVEALRETIPVSASPADAAVKARDLLARREP